MAMLRFFLMVAAGFFGSVASASEKAEPPDLAGIVRNDDYPIEAVEADEQGTVVMAVSIDGVGLVTSCVVKQSSGSAALDRTSCDAVRRRTFSATARRNAGRPGVVEVPLEWKLAETGRIPLEPWETRAFHSLAGGAVLSCSETRATAGGIRLVRFCNATGSQASSIAALNPDATSLVYDFTGVQGDQSREVKTGEREGETLVWRQVTLLTIDARGDVIKCEMPEAPGSPDEQRKECALIKERQQYEPLEASGGLRHMTEVRAVYFSRNPPVPPIEVRQIAPALPPVIAPPAPSAPPEPFKGQYARPQRSLVSLISADDYPMSAMDAREQGMVWTRILVAADGRVAGCSITESSGSTILDNATCQIIQRRARFVPATDERGNRIVSSYGQRIRWELDALPFAPIDRTVRISTTPGSIGTCMGGSDCDDSDYDPLSVWRKLIGTVGPGAGEIVINRRFDPTDPMGKVPLPILDPKGRPAFEGQVRVEVGYNGKVLNCSPVGDDTAQSARLCDLASEWLFQLGADKAMIRTGVWTMALAERPAR